MAGAERVSLIAYARALPDGPITDPQTTFSDLT
jgi:hypothetical protein